MNFNPERLRIVLLLLYLAFVADQIIDLAETQLWTTFLVRSILNVLVFLFFPSYINSVFYSKVSKP